MEESLLTNDSISGVLHESLTIEVTWNIGKALAEWLPCSGGVAVVAHGEVPRELIAALMEGLQLQGREALYGSVQASERIKQYIQDQYLAGGVLITCDSVSEHTHLTLYRETAEVIDRDNGLGEVFAYASSGNFIPAANKGTARTCDT